MIALRGRQNADGCQRASTMPERPFEHSPNGNASCGPELEQKWVEGVR
jgi:hypothetical protein